LIFLALALIGIGVWNLIVGMTIIGWICIVMGLLQGYLVIEKNVHGDW
jgi:hypothetical protein